MLGRRVMLPPPPPPPTEPPPDTPEEQPIVTPQSGGTIGIPEAPVDGRMYGRENAEWDLSVPIAGGTMTGTLILAGPAPNDPQAAVTKQYVDNNADLDGGTY